MKVNIYALVDPLTLKIRYIGRTKCSLKKRLAEHISKAKSLRDKTHKENWINSLLKINSKPYIRLLTVVEGWDYSHEFEINLIDKYKNRLLNHNDKGKGCLKQVSEDQRLRISNTLKEYYKYNEIQTKTKVYVYNYDGSFFKEFNSIKEASISLNIYHGTISKHLTKVSKTPNRIKMQFSYTKVEYMTNYMEKKIK